MAEGHQCRPDSVAICNMKNDVTWAGQKDNILSSSRGLYAHVGLLQVQSSLGAFPPLGVRHKGKLVSTYHCV